MNVLESFNHWLICHSAPLSLSFILKGLTGYVAWQSSQNGNIPSELGLSIVVLDSDRVMPKQGRILWPATSFSAILLITDNGPVPPGMFALHSGCATMFFLSLAWFEVQPGVFYWLSAIKPCLSGTVINLQAAREEEEDCSVTPFTFVFFSATFSDITQILESNHLVVVFYFKKLTEFSLLF